MDIVYIAQSAIPSRTANSIHVIEMCNAFAKIGHNISLYVPPSENDDNVQRSYMISSMLKIVFSKNKYYFKKELFFAFDTVRNVARKKNSIIYTRDINTVMWSMIYKSPFIYELHQTLHSLATKHIFRQALKSPDCLGVVFISEALKMLCCENGFREKKMLVLHDGVRQSWIEYFEKLNNGKKNDKPLVGYFGHLYDGRGIGLILEIALRLKDMEFIIVGGTDSDIARWKQEAEDKKCTNIIFYGFVAHNKVPELMGTCDVLLMPYENKVTVSGNKGNTVEYMSPMKMFEYMSSGKPIIASDLRVLREVLKHEENAYLVAPNDTSLWVKAIEHVISNQVLSRSLGKKAQMDVKEKYTWEVRAKRITEYIMSNAQ